MQNIQKEEISINVLRFFAWLNLLAGIIGSLFIFFNWGFVEVTRGKYYQYTEKVFNLIGVSISIGLLFEGVLGCTFFLVICSMAKNLTWIRRNTENGENKTTIKSEFPSEATKNELKITFGDDAVIFPYVTDTEWICSCGTHNSLDKSKKIQNCSNCNKNRDYILKKAGVII